MCTTHPNTSFTVYKRSLSTRHYYITALYKIDSCVSRLCNFLLTGNLPYTGFTFDLPECQSYIIYISAPVQFLLDQILYSYIYQLRFFYFVHFLLELIYYSSPKHIFKAQPKFFFGTIRYMQPVSALIPSFLSSSS
jgi:hypothetical protein